MTTQFWFPAKRYGWGWGLPRCWQGWLVFGLYLAAFALGTLFMRGKVHPAAFFGFVAFITAVLLIICWKKGEPPRWRWGNSGPR